MDPERVDFSLVDADDDTAEQRPAGDLTAPPEDSLSWAQDARTGADLHRLLRDDVVPSFAARDAAGIPTAWLGRIRSSMRSLAPRFSAARMLGDYRTRIYDRSG